MDKMEDELLSLYVLQLKLYGEPPPHIPTPDVKHMIVDELSEVPRNFHIHYSMKMGEGFKVWGRWVESFDTLLKGDNDNV